MREFKNAKELLAYVQKKIFQSLKLCAREKL